MSDRTWIPLTPQEIRAWIDSHPDELPRSWNDLGRFPMAFRRILINAVGPELRLQLWREHLETFLAPSSGLSERQREMIAVTIPELPALLAAPAPNPTMTEWERQASAVFSPQEAARVFMLIGPPEPPEGIQPPT